MAPRIVATRKLPEAVEARLAARFDVVLNPSDTEFGPERLAAALAEADGLLPTVSDRIDAGMLAGARARVIANFGVGVNNIDLDAARAAGIAVGNTPDVLSDATADIAVLLLLAVTRRARFHEQRLRTGRWDRFRLAADLGMGLAGKTLGILGYGRIGAAVAHRARAFGMEVLAYRRSGTSDWPCAADPLDLARRSDAVSVHAPGGPATRHLVDKAFLAAMRPGSVLINTARGDVVDEAALIDALASGHLMGAGLDVFEAEPHVPEALRAMDQVTLLPHIGSATVETRTAMGMLAVDNLEAFFEGREMPARVC